MLAPYKAKMAACILSPTNCKHRFIFSQVRGLVEHDRLIETLLLNASMMYDSAKTPVAFNAKRFKLF